MSHHSHVPDAFEFVCAVEQVYRTLMLKGRVADADGRAGESSLGGQLFYAGELDAQGRVLVVAGNIAGAATLCATADIQAQKQAVRDGVVDFLVTSLDEALRILKNQVRKRETVVVCVGIDAPAVEREMVERGVVPDLLRAHITNEPECPILSPGLSESVGSPISSKEQAHADRQVLVTWSVDSAPVLWMPKLDALALECVDPGDGPARRWLRLAPRYLGRTGQGLHLVHSTRSFAEQFIAMLRERIERGEIGASARIRIHDGSEIDEQLLQPRVSF